MLLVVIVLVVGRRLRLRRDVQRGQALGGRLALASRRRARARARAVHRIVALARLRLARRRAARRRVSRRLERLGREKRARTHQSHALADRVQRLRRRRRRVSVPRVPVSDMRAGRAERAALRHRGLLLVPAHTLALLRPAKRAAPTQKREKRSQRAEHTPNCTGLQLCRERVQFVRVRVHQRVGRGGRLRLRLPDAGARARSANEAAVGRGGGRSEEDALGSENRTNASGGHSGRRRTRGRLQPGAGRGGGRGRGRGGGEARGQTGRTGATRARRMTHRRL